MRFVVSAPFESARYCHCHNCQRRTGTSSAANARLPLEAFEVVQGAERLRSWQPPGGQGDPGIRPQYRQWVSSAVSWETIPDDGLPRFDGPGGPGQVPPP